MIGSPDFQGSLTLRPTIVLGILASLALLAVHQATYWPFTTDDAYITFRYADNFVRGFGIVFNPGERVEGYTNFLWLIVLAGLHELGADMLFAAKALGALCGAGTLVASAVLVRQLSGGRWTFAAFLTPLLLASTPSFAFWSVAGLETMAFTLLLTAGVIRFGVERERPSGFPWSGALMALAGLTRPEGAFLFALLVAFVVAGWTLRNRAPGRSLGRDCLWISTFLAIGLPYMAWRWSYYGHLFPNTFYVKTGRGLTQLLGGVLYVTSGIRKHGGVLFLLLALAPAIWGPFRSRAQPLAVLLTGWLAYNVYRGHDVLELFRFFVPILPLLFGMGTVALWLIHGKLREEEPFRGAATTVVALFAAGTVAINAVMSYLSHDSRDQLREYQLQLRIGDEEFRTYARRLLAIAPEGATIAVVDAGAMPYLTGWYTIDRFGLCDEHIAHLEGRGPLGEKFDAEYVLSKKPTFIQTKVTPEMERAGRINLGWAGDPELFASPIFQRDYVRLPDPVLNTFFVRRDYESKLKQVGAPALAESQGDWLASGGKLHLLLAGDPLSRLIEHPMFGGSMI